MNGNELISVNEAKKILAEQEFPRKIIQPALAESVGCVLASDILSPVDIPAFNQSSMDGYAFAFDDLQRFRTFEVIEEVPAGRADPLKICQGEAARIFTGAALPEGTDTVIMQEQTSLAGGKISFLSAGLSAGDNRRLKGADIKAGELALAAGTVLSEGAIGFLAGLGLTRVSVFARPAVSIVITGDELQQPGQPLRFGQVYEASSVMLKAALSAMGIHEVSVFYAKDELDETVRMIETALQSAALVLVTGGVSVGDYDFVVRASELCGITALFHKVKQRPGKPLFAGRKESQPVFGLPGNPSSVLTCFYQYVWPLLRRLMGYNDSHRVLRVPLETPHEKKHGLTHFLKGIFDNGKVSILPGQESYRMRSFATANCLVALEEGMRTYEKDEVVNIYLLPVYG